MVKITLKKTDCLSLLKSLPDDSVDLIATDPPYYRFKTEKWDNQWPSKQAFMDWLEEILVEYARVLKPTGSLYLFASPYLAAETEMLIAKHFNVLNHICWMKPTGLHLKTCRTQQRKYFPQTERIIFAESKKKQIFPYEPIRQYLSSNVKRSGLSSKEVDKLTGTQMSGHWFGKSQFALPSKRNYEILQKHVPTLTKPYPTLKRQFANARAGRYRRFFHVTKDVPTTDVWVFSVVQFYQGKHPCEKPLALMEHIIASSSRKGDLVMDTFLGSGTTAIAAHKLDRNFIGCEFGDVEFEGLQERFNQYLTKAGV